MIKRCFLPFLALLIFGCITPQAPVMAEPNEPQPLALDMPETIGQGKPFTVYLQSSHAIAGGRSRLLGPTGNEIASAPVFLAHKTGSIMVFASIFSIPASALPGTYMVRLSGSLVDEAGIPVVREKTLTVTDARYATETLKLNPSLTKLTTEPDPKKAEESEFLWNVLSVSNPEAVYVRGTFILPVKDERRTSQFGLTRTYIYSNKKSSTSLHYGIDFAGKTGTPVLAPARGVVVLARTRILTGNSVLIEHLPGCFSIYYHMDSILVQEGDLIEQGTQIGTIGMTGFATGPHLHWEVRINGTEADPDWFLTSSLLDKTSVFSKINKNEGR